jgi:hypothetical protein
MPHARRDEGHTLGVGGFGRAGLRNVRVKVEGLNPEVIPVSYMQGMGDIPVNATVGKLQDGTIDPNSLLYGEIGKNAKGKLGYRIRVTSENAPEKVIEGAL